MNSELFDVIIPSIAFFIAFFVAYSLVEALIILLLNRLIFRTWGFTPEKLIKSQELYGQKIKIGTLISIVILLVLLIRFTGLIGVLQAATPEVKVLAVETFLAMILIYLTTTRPLTRFDVERSIHKYLYVYLSIIVFTFTMLTADRSYASYKDFINANVTATIRGVEQTLESREKDALVDEFRQQIYRGQCPETDFTKTSQKNGITNFVYVTTSSDLIRADVSYDDDLDVNKDLRGRLCTDGAQTFLLTDHGRWYWVIES